VNPYFEKVIGRRLGRDQKKKSLTFVKLGISDKPFTPSLTEGYNVK
jgi:hypothetical protein